MSKASQNEEVRSITVLLKARLSKKRFTHSVNVARAAFALAERWGADPQKAYLAGLLHDCCKELPFPEQEELMRGGPFVVSDVEWRCKPVWHGTRSLGSRIWRSSARRAGIRSAERI